ncbi:MAG: sulfite exporter TauE/SafE family protein [Faecalibacterium sp.]|nr:sulfite exporter TauE/SafE family protein [Ruminococcus sp.]MCM1392081.1 sulfite exporter TauE/SafE family protein [Ruminococcus sp.]MCM1485006.1 sulfite exporter TauE/SafE family protein [Faecalibacterium sp.]
MKKYRIYLSGVAIGFVNALLGAGGGMIAVPLLRSLGLNQKQAQATAISIIFPLSIITCAVYLKNGYVTFSDALPFIPFGFAGAILGTKIFKNVSSSLLKKVFALFMLWAGIRMIMR